MDGNGRWAQRRGLGRTMGHEHGARTVRRVVEAAVRLGVGTLTLYAFSRDNWRRPRAEVDLLMALFRRFLAQEIPRCRRNGVRVLVIGQRHRLSRAVVRAIEACEAATATGRSMVLRLAVDYSAREQIALAARSVVDGRREELDAALQRVNHPHDGAGPVDLVVRTSGEQRLSDFLLWECAYAEILFVEKAWPEFTEADLADALAELRCRQRRFGGLPGSTVADVPAEVPANDLEGLPIAEGGRR